MSDVATAPEETPEESARPPDKMPKGEWVRKNLFNNWYNSVLTVVLALVSLYLLVVLLRFVFVTGQWEAVRRNLTLFMMGTYPRSDQWRLIDCDLTGRL